jgi:YkoY family integral membrane protein
LFSQTFDLHDLFVILVLVVLEGVLSIDNALVLGLLARRLPHEQRRKALTYGLVGAFTFRLIAIAFASWLLRTRFVKLLGGAYLIYLAAKHLVGKPSRLTTSKTGGDEDPLRRADAAPPQPPGTTFWSTVMAIELTDIAFAVDSILAAVALVAEEQLQPAGRIHPKLWVVVTGGMLGVVLVRVAAAMFIKLLDRFPRFEMSAYLLVCIIGVKLIADWWFNVPGRPPRVDFTGPSHPAFWIFWTLMAAAFCVGFIPRRAARREREVTTESHRRGVETRG